MPGVTGTGTLAWFILTRLQFSQIFQM